MVKMNLRLLESKLCSIYRLLLDTPPPERDPWRLLPLSPQPLIPESHFQEEAAACDWEAWCLEHWNPFLLVGVWKLQVEILEFDFDSCIFYSESHVYIDIKTCSHGPSRSSVSNRGASLTGSFARKRVFIGRRMRDVHLVRRWLWDIAPSHLPFRINIQQLNALVIGNGFHSLNAFSPMFYTYVSSASWPTQKISGFLRCRNCSDRANTQSSLVKIAVLHISATLGAGS